MYALIIILLGVAIIAVSVYLLFYVQGIEIKGNEYTADKVILESVQKDKYSVNSLYLIISLTYSNKSLAEISSYLCFSSQSYFQNVFKRKYGITPKQYREKARHLESS